MTPGGDPLAATARERRSLGAQRAFGALFRLAAFLLLLPVLLVLAAMVVQGVTWFGSDSALPAAALSPPGSGLWPALVGTIWITTGTLVLVVPFGVAAAVYLVEYAHDSRLTRAIHLGIANLAAVPSIVHALFGVAAFVQFLHLGTSILAASCTLAVLNLPTVIVASGAALQAVPRAFREACWSLGATRWQTIRHVVLPNAAGGVLTAVILAVSRAAGETVPVMFTGAVFYVSFLPSSPLDPAMALPLHLYNVATQADNAPGSLPFAIALTLVVFVLTANALAIALRHHLRRSLRP